MSTDPRMLLPGSAWPNTTLQSATMNSSQHSPPFQLAAQPSENAAAMVHLQRQLLLRQQQAQALALAGVGHVGTGAYFAGATRRSMALSASTPSSPPAKRQRTGGTQPEATSKRQPKATPTRKQPLTSTRICPRSQTTAAPQSSATPLQLTPMVATAGPTKASSSLPNVSTPLPLEAVAPTLSIPLPSNTSQPPLANSANGPVSQPLFHTFQATALPFSASGATGSSPGFSSAAQRSSPGPAKIRMKKPSVPTPRRSRSKLALDRLHKMQVSVPMDITKPRSKAASPPPQPMLTVPGTAPTQPVASQGLEATMATLPGPLPLSPGLNAIASTNDRLASDGSLANKPLESLTAPIDLPNAIDEVPKSHHLLDSTLTPPDDSLPLFQFDNNTASLSTSAPSFASFAALMAGDTETSEAKPLRPTVSRSTTVSTDTVPNESVLDPSLHDAFDADTLTTLTAATSENHPAIPTSTASTIADQIEFAGADSLLDLDRQLEDITEFLEKDVDLLTPVASKSMITTASSTHTDAANSLLSSSRPLSFPLTSPHHGMATQEDGVGVVSFANADTLLESVASSADQPPTGALDTPAAASIARSGNARLQGLQLPDLVLEEGMGVLDSDSDDP
ncbi:hypothetical protein H4R35_007312 [Dimargaris xerosporica]|nr:hypothetical protein H4R35_007312 [Dimargaris xerosporica]